MLDTVNCLEALVAYTTASHLAIGFSFAITLPSQTFLSRIPHLTTSLLRYMTANVLDINRTNACRMLSIDLQFASNLSPYYVCATFWKP